MPLHIPAVAAKIDIYDKEGTSGTAVATLTEQTIPEMQETVNAKAGDKIIISHSCLLDLGPGNDIIPAGLLPYSIDGFEGGGVPPSDLDKFTDKDDETSTTTATVYYSNTGNVYYDLGEKIYCTIRLKVSCWRVGTGEMRVSISGSDNGIDWTYTGLYYGSTLTSESVGYINGEVNYRYLRFNLLKYTGSYGYVKLYEFNAWKGDADEPPYLAIWPEINGTEIIPKGKEYSILITPASFLIVRFYEIPEDGEYAIKMKMQEFARAEGEQPYESYYQINGNERMLIIQHIGG